MDQASTIPGSVRTASRGYQRLLIPLRPVEIERKLEDILRRPVVLAITANGTSMVRVMPDVAGQIRIRLHAMFLYAPGEVLTALARYALRPHDVAASEALDLFIGGESHRVERGPLPPEEDGRGARYDLKEMLDDLNERFFGRQVKARIIWSKGSVHRRRRSILFGSYLREPGVEIGTIKIHPALDADWVPRGFVEFVVHHEMLHEIIPTRCENGRRSIHPPEFRRRERTYPGYHEWRRWEKENLGRFLGKK